MSSTSKFNPGDGVEKAQRVRAQIRASAEEQGLLEYLEGDDFVPMKEPEVPEATTADSTRRYELLLRKFEAQRKAIGELRKEAYSYLSEVCYHELAIRMGESPSTVLTAKAIYHGFNEHFCVMTDAQSTSVLRSLQTKWLEGRQLSRHVLAHGAARAQLVAGGKAPSEEQSKDALWLSLEELRGMALYSGLVDGMEKLRSDRSVSMSTMVASFAAELKGIRYQLLEKETAIAPSESALAIKDKDRKKKLAETMRENKIRHADCPEGDNCPVHPEAKTPHTWGTCSHYTGERIFNNKKK